MTKTNPSSRRAFLKTGALLAAPLAAAPAVALAADGTKARLQKLEDEAAIRDLHQNWLRKINAGERDAALGESVRRIATDHVEPDAIDLAADGKSATGRFHCAVDVEDALPTDTTIAQMAHAQGHGFISRTERRILKVDYAKTHGAWTIRKAELV